MKLFEVVFFGMLWKEFFWKFGCIYGVMFYIRVDSGWLWCLMGDDFLFVDFDEVIFYIIFFLMVGFVLKF